MENKRNRYILIYKTVNKKRDKTNGFQKFKTIRSLERETYNNDLSSHGALEQQIRLKDDINIFKEATKQKEWIKKEKKTRTLKNANILLKGKQKVVNAFESGIFPKGKQWEGLTSI